MARLAGLLSGLLGTAGRLLGRGRRDWAEALRAEAGQVPAGWPRLGWLAGGLWLVAREGRMIRKAVYWLGLGAVAAAAAWVITLSWRVLPAPNYNPQAVTDRVRVLVGTAALVVLPWVGRRHGWFGPVGASITARLVRVAGCAGVCGLGFVLVRMDSHLRHGANVGPFSLPREIAGLVLAGFALAVPAAPQLMRSRWPGGKADDLWQLSAAIGLGVLLVLPLQVLPVVYVAGVLAATSRRSPVATGSLAVGAAAGLAAGLVTYEAITAMGDSQGVFPVVVFMTVLPAIPAGLAAAWLMPGGEGLPDPGELRAARIRQAMFAGAVAGAVCGLLLTLVTVAAVFLMVAGPLFGALVGAGGGAIAADHPRKPRPDRSWAAGLFVSD